jgi:prephenate dehydrogenase
MKVAIIGAGKMGRWFAQFFLNEGDTVIVSSRSKEKLSRIRDELGVEVASNVDAVKKADRVMICVPIDNFEDIVKEIQSSTRPDQVVMDICSVKESPVNIMHRYLKTGITLGTHPMFGPGAKNIKNQNVALTPTTDKERVFADDFKKWLENRGAHVFIMSPRKHDELMSVVLGLTHFIGIVVCDTLVNIPNFVETRKVSGISYRMLLTLAEAIASEEGDFYTSLQMNLPKVDEVEGAFLKNLGEWLDLVRRKDRSAFANKLKHIKTKLMETDPDYSKSYEAMYKFLEAIKG